MSKKTKRQSKPSKSAGAKGGSAAPTLLEALQEIKEAHDDADYKTDKILYQRGWTHTSNTPGSYWLWQKELPDGRTVLVNRNMAVEFEKDLCGEIPW